MSTTSNGYTGNDKEISVCATQGGSYIPIGEILDSSMPGFSREEIDMTSSDTTGGHAICIPSPWRKGKPISFDLIHTDAQEQVLEDYRDSDALLWFHVVTKTGLTWEGQGFFSDMDGSMSYKDKLIRKVTVTPSGAWSSEINT